MLEVELSEHALPRPGSQGLASAIAAIFNIVVVDGDT